MNKLSIIALCAAMAVPAIQASVNDATRLHKRVNNHTQVVKSRLKGKNYPARAAEAGAKWCAGTQKAYGWNGESWELEQTYLMQYNALGKVTVENVTDIEGYVTRTSNTWNDNGALASRLVQVAESEEATFENSSKLDRTYDSRVTDFITANEQYIWEATDWLPANYYTQTVTRDDAGNVTLMERAVYYDGVLDPTYRLKITYGSDGKATSIQESDLTYDWDTDSFVWADGTLYSDIVWETTDGQILSVDNLFEGTNRISSMSVSEDGGIYAGTYTATYNADGSYRVEALMHDGEEDEDIQAVLNFTPLDDNGSCKIVTENIYTFGGEPYWYESTTETYKYDAYGLILLEEIQFSDGTYGEVEARTEGEVTYDKEHGYPLTWTVQEMDYETQEMYYAFRAEYSDYVDASLSGIAAVGADSEAPVEYYNLQGVKVENPAAGNVYIRRQGNKVTKVLVK